MPAWLAYLRRHTAQLDEISGYDPRSDPERNDAGRYDLWVLDQLAELSRQMTPWDAAMQTFGGSE